MSNHASCIYEGTVVHRRLTPKRHGFSYRVFALCLDVDEIDTLDASLRLFSRNRRNLVSFADADMGAPGAAAAGTKARTLLDRAGLGAYGERIMLVCYPRLFGRVFNPLSVYFCRNAAGAVGAVIYEVTNTYGERRSYVIPADGGSATIGQACAKEMFVSPFTERAGSYGFHCIPPGERVVIGVNFRDGGRPVLKTHFRGERRPLTDGSLASLLTRYPLMTVKVLGAIHFEAARLWAKGVPLVARHTSPAYSFTIVDPSYRETHHA